MKLLLVVILFGLRALACGSTQPIAIPWKEQITKSKAKSRGIPFSMADGNEMGLRISTMFSDTRLQDKVVCEYASDDAPKSRACENDVGGFIDTDNSEYWHTNPSNTEAFTPDPNDAIIVQEYGPTSFSLGYQTGYESVKLTIAVGNKAVGSPDYTYLDLPDYQFGVLNRPDPSQKNQVKSGIGLGKWSYFLDRLLKLDYVPSRIVGFYRGSLSDNTTRTGEMVVGGVNLNAIEGASINLFKNFTITDVEKGDQGSGLRCALQIPISDFIITVDGRNHSLFPNSDFPSYTFACVDTFQQTFTLPEAMMARLITLTGAEVDPGNSTELPRVWVPREREGVIENVIIDIRHEDGDFQVVIPGDEVINPYERKNAEGNPVFLVTDPRRQLEFRNQSVNYPVSDLPLMIFAGAFLSRQYLMVDYSRNIFGLAPASLSGGVSNGTDLYKICELDTETQQSQSAENSRPAVIGLAVVAALGWLLVIILVCLIIFKFKVRQKRTATIMQDNVSPHEATFFPRENGLRLVQSPIETAQAYLDADISIKRPSAVYETQSSQTTERKNSSFSTAPTIQRRGTGLES